jgi:hypothetical protein
MMNPTPIQKNTTRFAGFVEVAVFASIKRENPIIAMPASRNDQPGSGLPMTPTRFVPYLN